MRLIKASFIGSVLALAAATTHAQGLNEAVRMVAQSGMDMAIVIAGKPAEVIYVGASNNCAQVAVRRQGSGQQNFEVCEGMVRDKSSVAPSWPVGGSTRELLSMVVQQAMLRGRSVAIDENGYLIEAERANDIGECSTVDIKVSYDGDLVDRDIRKVCR